MGHGNKKRNHHQRERERNAGALAEGIRRPAAEQPTGFIRSADPETGEEDRLAVFLPEGVTFSDLQVFDVGGGP